MHASSHTHVVSDTEETEEAKAEAGARCARGAIREDKRTRDGFGWRVWPKDQGRGATERSSRRGRHKHTERVGEEETVVERETCGEIKKEGKKEEEEEEKGNQVKTKSE